MIGTVDVEIQAKFPSMPLDPMQAFVNSPSSIRLRNVPKRIGKWAIESVQFVAAYPDGSIKTAQCVLTGGVWVGTIEGTSTSGTSKNGYTIFASGTDENGEAVSGYILGKGDIEILNADGTLTPGEDVAYVHLLSGESDTPKDGDLYPSEDGYKIWQDGEGHLIGDDSGAISALSSAIPSAYNQIPLPDALNGSAGSLSVYARGDHQHPFAPSIMDGNGNRINSDRTCKRSLGEGWVINQTDYMSGTKTDSYYIEGSQKNTLVFANGNWTYTIYTKSGDEWVVQNQESQVGQESATQLYFSTLYMLLDWELNIQDEILATEEWVTAQNYATTTQLSAKQDKLSEAQITAIDQDAEALLTKFYVLGEQQEHSFIASTILSKSDFAAQGVYDTTTGTWTRNILAVKTGTNVTGLEANLFKDVTTLNYFEGPELSFSSGGAQAFGGCTGLDTLILPKMALLPINFCKGCTGLQNLTIPASATSIGQNAFKNCANLSLHFEEKSLTEVQAMLNYPWGLSAIQITASKTATQEWVGSQGYATQTWVGQQGFITSSYPVKNDGGVANAKAMTQNAYDALQTKDSTTLYVITEN